MVVGYFRNGDDGLHIQECLAAADVWVHPHAPNIESKLVEPHHRCHELFECQGRDHRSIADRLELHVSTILRALQFDHDEIRALVDAEEVDPTSAVLPVSKLLGDHQRVGREHIDPGLE